MHIHSVTMQPRKSEEETPAGWGIVQGARLRALRLREGYRSQPQFSRKTGIHIMTICRHETAETQPKPEQLRTYARVLRTTEAYLVYGVGDAHVPLSVERYLDSGRGLGCAPEVADRLRRMPWSLLLGDEAREPDEKLIDEVRQLIDCRVRHAAACRDDLLGPVGAVSCLREPLPARPRARHQRRGSRTTA